MYWRKGRGQGYCMNWHIVTTLCQWSGILCILLDLCGLHVIIAIVLKISFNIYFRYIYHETDLRIGGVITIDPNQRPLCLFPEQFTDAQTCAQLVICSRAIIQKFANPQTPKNLAILPVAIWITAIICNNNLFTWVTDFTLRECSKKTRHLCFRNVFSCLIQPKKTKRNKLSLTEHIALKLN